jgi:hypothetical protein
VRKAEQLGEIRVASGTIAAEPDPVGMLATQGVVGSLSDPGIRRTRNGKSFGKYAHTVLTDDVNYRGPSDKAK